MSADNIVCAFPFQKESGEVVWRVAELSLSGLAWEQWVMCSTRTTERRFVEFEGKNAGQQAHARARKIEKELPICEYGTDLAELSTPPLTYAELQARAVKGGYSEFEVYAYREAQDRDLRSLPRAFALTL